MPHQSENASPALGTQENPNVHRGADDGSTVGFAHELCERLVPLYEERRIPSNLDGSVRDQAVTQRNNTYDQVLALVAPRFQSQSDEDAIQMEVAYLYALRHPNPVVRAGLTQFLDHFLAYGAQLDPNRLGMTVAVTGHTSTAFAPATGIFDDAAPLAAWLSQRLGVPVEKIHVSPAPFHPAECLDRLLVAANTALRTKLPETLLADLDPNEVFRAYEPQELEPGESTATSNIVFFASIDIPALDAANTLIARVNERDDGTACVRLPYTFNGTPGVAEIAGLAVDAPFRGMFVNAFEPELDDIRQVWRFLRDNGHPAEDIGIQFRIDRRFDEEEPRCRVDIYSVRTFDRFMQTEGVRYVDREPFMHLAFGIFSAAGVGEIMVGRNVAYRAGAGFLNVTNV